MCIMMQLAHTHIPHTIMSMTYLYYEHSTLLILHTTTAVAAGAAAITATAAAVIAAVDGETRYMH